MIYSITHGAWIEPRHQVTLNFQAHELADPLEGILFINMRFMQDMVEPLRMTMAKQFKVNSACRSLATNLRVKGHPRSLHLMFNKAHKYTHGTLALDISSVGWSDADKAKFAREAKQLGLSVGFNDRFFHIDGRVLAGLPQATFTY